MGDDTQTYPTDLKYGEWLPLAQFFATSRRGGPPKWERWQIVIAILYVTRTGCLWRMLPKNFPPWQTVYGYFWRWTQSGLWARLNAALVRHVRQQQGRQPARSAVDTLGLLLLVVVHSPILQDRAGGYQGLQTLFDRIKPSVHNRWCRLKLIWADGGYQDLVRVVRQQFGGKLEIVRRPEGSEGFSVLPRRWWWSAVSPGWPAFADWLATTNGCPRRWPVCTSWPSPS